MILLRTLLAIVSATASLLPLILAGILLMAAAMPLFTIRSKRPISPKSEIVRGASARMYVNEVAHVGLVCLEVDRFSACLPDYFPQLDIAIDVPLDAGDLAVAIPGVR